MRDINKIDYAGFTYAGIHTSQFGLYSVSSGDRYQRYLSPTIKNQTAENSGGTGTYYFGSRHTQQNFNFTLAFDSVTESELREIRQWLNSEVSPLILDETPYIQYYVKVSNAPQIDFVVFDSDEGDIIGTIDNKEDLYSPDVYSGSGRIYKGEIAVSFMAFEPYGYSVKKWSNEYSLEEYPNKADWIVASKLRDNSTNVYDRINSNKEIRVYNAGDYECPFVLTIPNVAAGELITINNGSNSLEIKIDNNVNSSTLIIDVKKRLVIFNHKVANNMITGGDFFNLPLGESIIRLVDNNFSDAAITYKYYYI